MDTIIKDLVFGPHNTTTVLTLTLVLVYFGFLVPRPTHRRAQELNDKKDTTIDTLLNDYKDDLGEINTSIDDLANSVERLERKIDQHGCTDNSNIEQGGTDGTP